MAAVNDWEDCTRAASCFLCDLMTGQCPWKIPASGTFQADDGWTVEWDIPCHLCDLECPPPDCGAPGSICYYDAEGGPQTHTSGKIETKDLLRALSKFKKAHNVQQLEMAL